MKSKGSLFILGSLAFSVACLLGISLYLHRSHRAVAAPTEPDDVAETSARGERVAVASRPPRRFEEARRPTSAAPPLDPPPPLAAPSAAEASLNPKTDREMVAAVEAAFAADPTGSPGAANTQANIATAFRDPRMAGAVLREVDCHNSRCKLAVDFTDADADRHVFPQIFNALGSAGVDTAGLGFIVPERTERPDGTIAAVVHLYRSATPY